MVLRPTRRALVDASLRATAMALPGLLLVYAAWSSRVITPAIFGTPLIILGVVIFANVALSRIRLVSGVLSARTLLGRGQVRVDQITKVVPTNLSFQRTLFTRWNRSARVFEVRTHGGPAGFWLNPNVYGQHKIEDLIRAIGIQPQALVQDRTLEPFTLDRNNRTR